MVVMKICLGDLCKMRRIKCSGIARRDYTKLAENDDLREAYEARVTEKIGENGETIMNNQQRYDALKKAVKEAAEETLPAVPHNKNGTLKYLDDEILNELSREQRKLSKRIYHSGKRDAAKVRQLRRYRSAIYTEMRQRIAFLEERRTKELAKRLMESKGNRQLFEVQRYMSKTTRLQLRLQDAEGNDYTEHKRMVEPLQVYYEGFFSRAGDTPLSQWRGDARPLQNQITAAEFGDGAVKLGSNRAIGPDLIAGEQIKYAGV
jgi:hypothetical protein